MNRLFVVVSVVLLLAGGAVAASLATREHHADEPGGESADGGSTAVEGGAAEPPAAFDPFTVDLSPKGSAPEPIEDEKALLLFRADLEKNAFFGTRRLWELQNELAEQAEDPILLVRLGSELLKAGKNEDAYAACLRGRIAGQKAPPYDGFGVHATWRLALTALRKAEAENCVAQHFPESCIFPLQDRAVHRAPLGAKRSRVHLIEHLDEPELADLEMWRSRWILNVVGTALNDWPGSVPEEHRLPFDPFTAEGPLARYPNVAKEVGFEGNFIPGGSLVVDDFTGDGHSDVLTCGWLPTSRMRLFINDGAGQFEEELYGIGLQDQRGGIGLHQADYDNDGDLDVFVVRGGQPDPDETPVVDDGRLARNSLLRNDGTGKFTDVTLEAGLGEHFAPYSAAAWADFDGDGLVDLYVATQSDANRYHDQLFKNAGDGTFEDVTVLMGVENARHAMAAVWGDYDDDGDPDLFIANYGSLDRLYRNDGDHFIDIASNLGIEGESRSHGAWWLDADADGRLDLLVTSYGVAPGEAAADIFGKPIGGPTPHLFLNRASLGFVEVTADWGLDRVWMSWSGNVGDVDGDGFEDFYLGTGGIDFDALFPNVMLRNDGGKRFEDVTVAGGFGHLQKASGVAFADLDADGDREVLVRAGGCFEADGFVNVLFENPGTQGNKWVTLILEGTRSNRSGIGARLTIRVRNAEAEGQRSITRWVSSGGSYGSSPLRAEIGLGRCERIESIEVRWPGGNTETFKEVPLDAIVRLVEGKGSPERVQ